MGGPAGSAAASFFPNNMGAQRRKKVLRTANTHERRGDWDTNYKDVYGTVPSLIEGNKFAIFAEG